MTAPHRPPVADLLLLLGACLLLVGTLTLLGALSAGKAWALPLASVASGLVLVLAGSLWLDDLRPAAEVVLSSVSVPCLLFGIGLLLRALEGRPASLVLGLALLVAGAAGVYAARQLIRRRLWPRRTDGTPRHG
jgi:hypothetical protein